MIINNNNNSDNNDDADDNDDDGHEVNENNYWELHNFPVLVSQSLNPNPQFKYFFFTKGFQNPLFPHRPFFNKLIIRFVQLL